MFVGSIKDGFYRIAHLRGAALPGGDAAAQFPVQAAAGFLIQVEDLPDLTSAPFSFPERYHDMLTLASKGVRSFRTTSMGRLFDAAAALLGFTREASFEGQAAVWLEQLARSANTTDAYPFPFDGKELDFRPLLREVARDRSRGRRATEIARAFQRGSLKVFPQRCPRYARSTKSIRPFSRAVCFRTNCSWRMCIPS